MALRTRNILSLCAGVGGLELGISLALRLRGEQSRGILYVEREAAAAASLVASMEAGWLHPAPVWSDLLTFDARAWRGLVHILASGDPCQDNSVAGKREGEDGERFLAPEVIRVAEECRPDLIFRENVPGNADGQLAAIAPPLEGLGYRLAAGIFSSAETGNTMRRERLFIMAVRVRDRQQWSSQCDVGSAAGQQASCWNDAERCRSRLGSAVRKGSLSSTCTSLHRSEEGRGPWDAEPERRSGAMGSAKRSGDGRISDDPGRGSIERTASDGAGDGSVETLGRSCSAEPQGQQRGQQRGQHHSAGWQVKGGHPLLSGGAILPPAVIPGPTDSRWIDVLDRFPELQPALSKEEAESHLRRGIDAMAHRTERLRATGNGVDPVAAAYAFLSLDALLASTAAT